MKQNKNRKIANQSLGIDEKNLETNRIIGIEESKEKSQKRNSIKSVLILSAIAVSLIFIVLLITYNFQPEKFSFLKQDKKSETTTSIDSTKPIESIEQHLSISSNNPHLKKGIQSYTKGYISDAITEFNEVIEGSSNNIEKSIALMYLGIISDEKKNYDKAITLYNKALKYNNRDFRILKNLAVAYKHKKDFSNAIKNSKKSLSINPDDIDTRIILGNVYYEQNNNKEAIKQYQIILEKNPNNGQVLYNLASALFKEGDEFSAIEYFKKAASIDKIGEVAHRSYSRLGTIFSERKQYDLAKKFLTNALAIRPKNAVTFYNIGIVYLQQNNKIKALENFKKAEELDNKNEILTENLAESYYSLKSYEDSLKNYSKLFKKNNLNIKALSRISEIHYINGDLDKAYQSYKKITELQPATENARIAFVNIGNILDDAQKYNEAAKFYKKALIINPKDSDTLYNLGVVYSHAEKPELAIKSWRKGYKLNPTDNRQLMAIALYYYNKGLYDEAENEYQKIISKWPTLQKAHFNLGSIYYKRNKINYALNSFRKALEINEKTDMARRSLINIALLTSADSKNEKKLDNSILYIQKALLLKPGDPESYFAMGTIYSKKSMEEKAIETFYQVIKSSRNEKLLSDTYGNIGKSYYKLGKYKKAMQSFTRGIEYNPQNEELRINRKAAKQAFESEFSGEN